MLAILGLIAIISGSCHERKTNEYSSVHDLSRAEMTEGEAIEFEFDTRQMDSTTQKNIGIIVRHSLGFHLSHIKLEIHTTNPDNATWRDTVAIALADANGKWMGRSSATHVDLQTTYLQNVSFTHQGIHKIRIRQLSNPGTLHGIEAIGITIDK